VCTVPPNETTLIFPSIAVVDLPDGFYGFIAASHAI